MRVITNLATGETGFVLADKFRKLGMAVTLLLGPGNFSAPSQGIKIKRFKYFSQLAKLLDQELKTGGYAAVIQAAAVADFRPEKIIPGKASSQRKAWKLNLVPTEKLIKKLKKYQPEVLAVGFKFQPQATKQHLISKARGLLSSVKNLDFVVANSDREQGYQAYILSNSNIEGPFSTKSVMAQHLAKLIISRIKSEGKA